MASFSAYKTTTSYPNLRKVEPNGGVDLSQWL
jgi:hypothetical protein